MFAGCLPGYRFLFTAGCVSNRRGGKIVTGTLWCSMVHRAVYSLKNGRAVTPGPKGRVISPWCKTYPSDTLSPKSFSNIFIAEAMAERGVAESLPRWTRVLRQLPPRYPLLYRQPFARSRSVDQFHDVDRLLWLRRGTAIYMRKVR